jgi:hypothetical protein
MARHLLRLAAVAGALMFVPTTALGAAGYDFWTGTAKGGKVSVQYIAKHGSKTFTGGISYPCTLGQTTGTYTASDLKGTAHGKSITLKGSAFGTSGKSTVIGSLKKKGAKATLKVNYDFGDEDASTNCKLTIKKIHMKHEFTTGG